MHHTGPTGPFDQWPTQRGFDRFYGFMDGAMNQWEPFLTEDNHHVATPDDPNYHLSIDITNRALSMITSQKSLAPEKPFFLYMAFGAGHSPHHVPKEMIDEYVPIFEKGWDVTRDERIARQKAMGIIPQDTVLPPRNPGVRAWTELNADEKRLFVRFQAAYAAMLTHTDQQIGRVIDTLETIGQLTNTIFIVMSDNGASQEGSHFGTMHQGRYFERAPITLEQSIDKIDEIGETQWFNNYPLGWAMAGNTPCKFYKQNTHGGGVRDPLVMHWPAGFDKSEAGTLRHQFHHVSDLSPTMLEVLGVGLPKTMNGVDQMPLHGTPMTYTFAGASAPTKKKVQHFEMLGHRGIVADGWKAVTLHLPRTTMDQDVWELYDLNNDFSETNDLAAAHPDKLRELEALWWEEAAKYKVLPVDDGSGSRLRRPVRKKFVLWPGLERVPSDASPRLTNTSHTIAAHITVPVNGCEGVLLSEGDRWGGYVMFVQDGKPCFHYHFPLERHEVRGTQNLTPGDHVITWELTKVDRASGHGKLSVDGIEVASVDIPRIIRGWMPFNGLHVGRNNGAPVGTSYEAPFPFTGTLHRIEVELLDKIPGPDPDIENRSEMGKQ
jgi:arylsulfatase